MKIKVNKNLIATYLSLDSKKADEYLTNLAGQVKAEIFGASDNNEVFELLGLLEEFVYKAPEETVEIVSFLSSNIPAEPKIVRTKLDVFRGKSHKELILKSIGLLSHIRYIAPDEVLKLVAQLSKHDDKDISSRALEVAQELAKYNYHVLTKTKIGYGAQRKILDFILAWTPNEQLQHLDFIEVVAKELLDSSVEGSELTSVDTFTIHFGAVSPIDFLKRIRWETMKLINELYQISEEPGTKLRLVQVFDKVTRTPPNVEYGDDLIDMIKGDLGYLTDIYSGIVFFDSGKMTDNLAVVEKIERHLSLINRSERLSSEKSEELRKEILQDEFYQLFRLLAGDPMTYREKKSWDDAEQKRKEEIDRLIASIEKPHIEEWFDKLDRIATQHELIDDWQFYGFKLFLLKLAQVKPQLADKLLDRAFANNLPLKHFAGSFLAGFRIVAQFELWDNYADRIIRDNDVHFTSVLLDSLNLPEGMDLEKNIRENDIDLLENIVHKKDPFSFLSGQDSPELHYALINTLARNYKRNPEQIEPLMVKEIESNPQLLDMFFRHLPLVIARGWISVQELRSETVEFLKEKMIDLRDVDWQVQELLRAIGQRYGVRAVLDVFLKRIQKDTKRRGEQKQFEYEYYEAIPYHFNSGLSDFIAQSPEYKEVAVRWVAEMTANWSIYNWHVGYFLQRIGKGLSEILMVLIEEGNDDSLMKAARAMHSIEGGVDFDLCIEIIRRTDNRKILSQVATNMYATGVVSGEYGIAVTHEKKAEALKKFKDDESERVRNFAADMMKSFQDSAQRERQRAEEDKLVRRIEFQG